LQRPKAAGDFLPQLHHAAIAFGLIVGEGNRRIAKEAQSILFARCQAQDWPHIRSPQMSAKAEFGPTSQRRPTNLWQSQSKRITRTAQRAGLPAPRQTLGLWKAVKSIMVSHANADEAIVAPAKIRLTDV
jgi:hypothetical protein